MIMIIHMFKRIGLFLHWLGLTVPNVIKKILDQFALVNWGFKWEHNLLVLLHLHLQSLPI